MIPSCFKLAAVAIGALIIPENTPFVCNCHIAEIKKTQQLNLAMVF
jgi:hypothetical protein